MSETGEKMSYLFCLEIWFEEFGDYEKLRSYIINSEDKAAVGTSIIDCFEKILINKPRESNFMKQFGLVAQQFLLNGKEQPEVFANELLMEVSKIQNKDESRDKIFQLEKLERNLRNCNQQGQTTLEPDSLTQYLQSIEEGLQYFVDKIEERALISDLRKLAKMLYKSLGHICRLLGGIDERIRRLFVHLFKNCIFMEVPPPRILKKQTKPNTGTSFKVSLRLLFDDEYIKNTPPVEVKGYYIHESYLKNFDVESHQKFEIPLVNGTEHFAGDLCSFKKLKVNPGKQRGAQTPKPGCRRSEEKGLLVFRAVITPKSCFINEPINVYLLSKPVVLTVHTNQHAEAEATILWDDNFPVYPRTDFSTQPEVEIGQLVEAVSKFFANHTGRGFSDDNKRYLERLLYNHTFPKKTITFQKVFRDKLKQKAFSFWDWIYSAFRLIKEYLLPLWKEGIIHGFIGNEECLELFKGNSIYPGSWLLRFSESVLGGITISLVDDQKQLLKWEPLTARHLTGSPLSKQILEYVDLKYFIDGRSKEDLLSPVLDCGEVHDGYVPCGMRGILPPILNVTTPSHEGTEEDNDDEDMDLPSIEELDFLGANGLQFADIDLDMHE